jgi:uncharacterized protein (TIGR03083 family)
LHTIDVLHYGHLTVLHAVNDLPPADWLTPNVCGVWSVKEIIAHLASFELALADALRVARGEPFGGLLADLLRDGQAFNDTQVPARAALSPAETVAEYEAAHHAAQRMAAELPAAAFTQTGIMPQYGAEYDLDDFLAYTYYGHKREHSAQIAVFRDAIRR